MATNKTIPPHFQPDGPAHKTYFYINNPHARQFPEQELIDLDRAGYTVVLNRVAVDNVPPFVPAADRMELKALLRRIAPEDALVVLELSSLGCNARDVLWTLMQCRKAKIAVRCVELGGAELTRRPEPQAVKTLRAIIRMETTARSERSASSLKSAREKGRPTGRPASLSPADHERILRFLGKGLSVSEVARRFGTSRQTVMRVRAAAALQPKDS
ncbi:helix-turn-helix domain-containing protein [Paraburkholderia phymatum]|uniref:Resolvase helix-turn-helix domain protein n=1 Tax=Paraburkholderia phymatum (strain DSM 17167 / CIP 108236 / LMG 21445 / STM815) TaxID=391038 RepID=B2JWV4_PARP8|nr:helix-turn-helix domain-containing protein [Paraburkholderia phymatum]ACC75431.1 Resolvase helix-turn-helix domain protein [Paraburkholderia phymatum STM815]